MSVDLIATSARQGDTWLRQQTARIEQRHLQFGRRCRLDLGSLLLQVAHRVQVAPPMAVAAEQEGVVADSVHHSTRETVDHRTPKQADGAVNALERSPSGTAMPRMPTPSCRRVHGPATLGDFVASDRGDAFPYREWVATPADRTSVVVSDWCAAPSALDIEKAVSIVQSRAYLEHRARLLLPLFGEQTGSWRLATIDFASAARRHRCEFLMCFCVQDTSGALSITSPSVEIGFALPAPGAMDPVFVLTVATVVGFPT
jgi:hypothetical protein